MKDNEHLQQNNSEESGKKPNLITRINQTIEQRKEEELKVKEETDKVALETLNEKEDDKADEVMPEIAYRNNKKKKLWFYIAFVVICTVCLLITALIDFKDAGKENIPFFETVFKNWQYFLLAILFAFLIYIFDSLKSSLILRTLTGKWKIKLSLYTTVVTKYYDNITPFASGGQPFAIYTLGKNGIDHGIASSIPIVSIFVQQVIFVMLAIGAFICDSLGVFSDTHILTPASLTMGIIGIVTNALVPVAVIIFSASPKAGVTLVKFFLILGYKLKLVKKPQDILAKTIREINNYRSKMGIMYKRHKLLLLGELFIALLVQIANCSIIFFTLKTFGYDNVDASIWLEWITFIQWSMVLYCMVAFIPTPGNSGASEVSFSALFSSLLAGTGLCFSATIMWRLLCFYMTIVIGIICTNLTRIKRWNRNKKTT